MAGWTTNFDAPPSAVCGVGRISVSGGNTREKALVSSNKMADKAAYSQDDIMYAMETTRVLHEPDRRIETFGTTSFEFHLITELMDSTAQVRVREGRIDAERPKILRPEGYQDVNFEGFGEQAEAFREWLKHAGGDLAFLKYGFNFVRGEMSESVVHESIEMVADRVVGEIENSNKPLNAVIAGIEDGWEFCLLKFTMDMVEQSHGINVFDMKRRGML